MSEHRSKNYYGSDLNKFIDQNCTREMSCINIDCLLLKRAKKKIRIIESKHTNETIGFSQREALSRLHDILEIGKKENAWDINIYIVRGDPPYDQVEIMEWKPDGKTKKINRENLVKWLEFEEEIDEMVPFEPPGSVELLSPKEYEEMTEG